MQCLICGGEGGQVREEQQLVLCDSCMDGTPAKVGKAEFIAGYFAGDHGVGAHIAREFYSDYLASKNTLAEYIEKTTFAV